MHAFQCIAFHALVCARPPGCIKAHLRQELLQTPITQLPVDCFALYVMQAVCGLPLSCVVVAGGTAIAGAEAGHLHVWQYAAAAGLEAGIFSDSQSRADADASVAADGGGHLQSLAVGTAAVNSVLPAMASAPLPQRQQVLAGTDDGSAVLLRCEW